MKRILLFFAIILVVTSCQKGNKFAVEGHVTGAKGSTLYFEHISFSKVDILDSTQLKSDGTFKFKEKRFIDPEFFRLRMGKQYIDLAIDSTETIVINADSATFSTDYTVEGSKNCQSIQKLSNARKLASNELRELDKLSANKEITQNYYIEQVNKIIDSYKETAKDYIISDPGSSVAYYALMQTINGLMIFDVYEKYDNKLFGAVATQWDTRYPGSEYSKQIKKLSLQGMKVLRNSKATLNLDTKSVDIFDIELPSLSGKKVDLVKYAEGKVTLLEFFAFQSKGSPEHNMLLSKVYEKYKDKGFQIYQVSLDADDHAWKNAAYNLPWMCVNDPASVYSEYARIYNVQSLPVGFMINRNGEVVERIESYNQLDNAVSKYLK